MRTTHPPAIRWSRTAALLLGATALGLAAAACGTSSPSPSTSAEPSPTIETGAPETGSVDTGATETGAAETTVTATESAVAAIVSPEPVTVRKPGSAQGDTADVVGTVTLDDRPVVGAVVAVDGVALPAPTGPDGTFAATVDATTPQRRVVTISDLTGATVDGEPLSDEGRQKLEIASGAINVAFAIADLDLKRNEDGTVTVSGRLAYDTGEAPEPVALTSYLLSGYVTAGRGQAIPGAIVSLIDSAGTTTTAEPTDGRGVYKIILDPVEGSDPYPVELRLTDTDGVPAMDQQTLLPANSSAQIDIVVDASGGTPSRATSHPGAYYRGVLVGVGEGGLPAYPVSATWPDEQGRFTFTLQKSFSGTSIHLFAGTIELFSPKPAVPGGEVDLAAWPGDLPPSIPQDLRLLDLP